MSQAPSMPMYWDAYLADTTHLTTEEHGAYLLLLAAMWRRNGSVPDNDADNARILGLSKAKWKRIKARLLPLLDAHDGNLSQKKLREIWQKTQQKISKNRENGAAGGRAKSSKNNNLDEANARNSLKRKATIPEPEPYRDTNVSHRRAREPEGFEEFWDQYPHRGGAKKGKTDARKSYVRALRTTPSQQILSGALRYATDRQVIEGFAKNPTTWLNQKGWEDDVEPTLKAIPGGKSDVFGDRPDPALEQIARLAGLGQASRDGGS